MATTNPTRRTVAPLLAEEVPTREAIIKVLEQAGIDTIFGMPGGNMGVLYNALYDHRDTIRCVLVREEARAGVMAEVYGRLTGRPGVALGQAAFIANVSMGAIEAHLSSSPMLILTDLSDNSPFSQHGPYQSGAGEYGSWDAPRLFSAITKMTMVANSPSHAVQCTQLAIKHALSGQPGPVAVLYHSQSLRGKVGPDTRPALYSLDPYLPNPAPPADSAAVLEAARILAGAERPLIIAGNGVRLSHAWQQLITAAEALGAPVTTTGGGKGTFAETHDLALGVCGNFGTSVANAEIPQADVILAVGSKLAATDFANENPKLFDPQRQILIQIDIEPKNASWVFPAAINLIGDASTVLSQLIEALKSAGAISPQRSELGRRRLHAARQQHGFFNAPQLNSDAVPILPQRAIKEVQRAVPNDAMVCCDAGENRIFMAHYFQTKAPDTYLQPAGVGGMGYAIPAAMAAKLANPNRPAVAVCGDGGFAIGMNGLMTALDEDIPITVVVLNNGALGWVRHGQRERNIACDFGNFDHAAIARSMGCDAARVERPNELGPALKQAISSTKPTVVEVRTSLDESFMRVTSPLVGG
ncbi:MAG TPA: thiamine pyrophosphate-binding protein [Candidatus Binataceae bacterium]|nr:thiamine pyrophosphate-binding protein [Candidatus Binataceae bacterium]